jgi:hypothetical protein
MVANRGDRTQKKREKRPKSKKTARRTEWGNGDLRYKK